MRRELCIYDAYDLPWLQRNIWGCAICVGRITTENGLGVLMKTKLEVGQQLAWHYTPLAKSCPALVIFAHHLGTTRILCLVLKLSPQCEVHCQTEEGLEEEHHDIQRLEHMTYKKRLRELSVLPMEKRRLRRECNCYLLLPKGGL